MFFLQSCFYNKEDILYPEPEKTDTLISYSKIIVPIITNNCFACHSNANANSQGASVLLEGQSNLKTVASNGKLLRVIKHKTGCPYATRK